MKRKIINKLIWLIIIILFAINLYIRKYVIMDYLPQDKDSFELLISVCAIIVAIFAFITSVCQAYFTRRHNKLSVKPILSVEFNLAYKNDDDFGISLKNNGIGPAILKDLKVFVEGKLASNFSRDNWEKVFELIQIPKNWEPLISCTTIKPDYSISAGDKKQLLKINKKGLETNTLEDMRNFLKKLKIQITYESIYGEQWKDEQDGSEGSLY